MFVMDMGPYVHLLQQLSTPFVFLHMSLLYILSQTLVTLTIILKKNLCSFITCELYIMKVFLIVNTKTQTLCY